MEENSLQQTAKPRAGIIALTVSFFMPLVGVIIYLANRKEVSNAGNYLVLAAAGFIFNIVLAVIAAYLQGANLPA